MSNNGGSLLKHIVIRTLIVTMALVAIGLFGLLALASANTEFFDRYYSLLYTANIAVAIIFVFIVGALVWIILARLRQRRFGTRLLAKLAIFFALVGVLPGGIIYLVSLQFVSRSIESWFDVRVETALDSGLELGRAILNNGLSDLSAKAQLVSDNLASRGDKGGTLTLLRMRDQFGLQDATIVDGNGRVLASASGSFNALVPDLPTPLMLRQARTQSRGYTAIEGGSEGYDKHQAKDQLRWRVVIRIPSGYTSSLQDEERFLQVTQLVPANLAQNAEAVQSAYREYQEKALGRTGLRKMYIGTLTLSLFLATFVAMMLALALGNQLARPLFLLARGTQEVAAGDLSPKGEVRTNDELGFLTQAFNAMTRQLSDARATVERNRLALESSKAHLESILSSLTAGVFVFDRDFRLTTANAGAERIFKQSFQGELNRSPAHIPALVEFGETLRRAFADRDANADLGPGGHWQQQIGLTLPGETDAVTLLVRGSHLPEPMVAVAGVPTRAGGGYVVVFDDISDVISAQRSVAWAEVARRLAHEIKNPLTPIQLSAERLQMKLSDKLPPADAEVLRRGATTIVNQVAAMKRMVDDFRDYARLPPAVMHSLQLNELIGEVLTLYGVEEGRGAIRAYLDADLPEIRGDSTQLRQVIHNLLQNAQDAVSATENPLITVETKTVEYAGTDMLPGEPKRTAVRLTITDNGPGFPARILTRAFEPYVTTKSKGTGLGLAMVKKIIDEHHARIDIRNRSLPEGEGSAGAQISILFTQLADDQELSRNKPAENTKVA
ncbi:Sensor histidine kinase ResE [Pandoraea terrigena]|uniref:histidine kinase n=2 Tax=Pandoraea terrigena TaxID=2508292 RepID=A0A5E4RM09_9BURK|nr:Sensor histidine kinase ResE [Pandoraea terrigena]